MPLTDAVQRGIDLDLDHVKDVSPSDFWDPVDGITRIGFDLEETLDALAALGVISDWREVSSSGWDDSGLYAIEDAGSGWSKPQSAKIIAAKLRTIQHTMNDFAE